MMRASGIILFLILLVTLASLSFKQGSERGVMTADSLRQMYTRPLAEWPKPTIDPGVEWAEFASITGPDTSYFTLIERPDIKLGKLLFFDPMLSGSNQISCSSCHDPQSSWGDGRSVALGNDHLQGNRNTISLLNVAERKSFFWDGRATTLEEQVHSPIAAHNEMNMKPEELGGKLAEIQAYRALFASAYGDSTVTFDRIAKSLAAFQRTITTRRSRFDRFIDGEHKVMSDEEIRGLHLFRTKARCMNCHHGQHLTDEKFHNIGLTYYKRKYEDLGRYLVTKDPDDVGKFRTPTLRDVMHGAPWMHNGMFFNILGLINIYNSGMQMNSPTPEEKAADPMHPVTDPLLKPLNLTAQEKQDIIAFLEAVTATQYHMRRPELPR